MRSLLYDPDATLSRTFVALPPTVREQRSTKANDVHPSLPPHFDGRRVARPGTCRPGHGRAAPRRPDRDPPGGSGTDHPRPAADDALQPSAWRLRVDGAARAGPRGGDRHVRGIVSNAAAPLVHAGAGRPAAVAVPVPVQVGAGEQRLVQVRLHVPVRGTRGAVPEVQGPRTGRARI